MVKMEIAKVQYGKKDSWRCTVSRATPAVAGIGEGSLPVLVGGGVGAGGADPPISCT
jgi:hypothetical protein